MGCAVSSVDTVSVDVAQTTTTTHDSPNTSKDFNKWNITDKDKEIIKCSWHILRKDLTNNGLCIFLRIFEMCPKVKTLFGLDKDEESSTIKQMPKIRGHGLRFMQAIGAAVDNIDDIDNTVTMVLLSLGKQHRHFGGFFPEYFDLFYDAMLGQWTEVLGDKFSSDVLDAWGHLFVFMMETLKKGYSDDS